MKPMMEPQDIQPLTSSWEPMKEDIFCSSALLIPTLSSARIRNPFSKLAKDRFKKKRERERPFLSSSHFRQVFCLKQTLTEERKMCSLSLTTEF